MSPDSIPQLSLGTAALIIFAACAGFLALRGMTRMIIGTLVLGLSAWIGFQIWQMAPSLSVDWTGKSTAWITTGLPILVFIVSFFLIRKIIKTLVRPFSSSVDAPKPRSFAATAFRLLLALIPTAILCLIGVTLLHHNGSIAEVRAFSEKPIGPGETAPPSFSQRLKSAVETAIPASWLKSLDPLADPSRVNLAKLITAQSDSPLTPVINPQTGQPIPRAIIVNDPELQNLARQGNFGTLLRHPLLTKALEDPTVKKLLQDLSL
ncbi:MAG: hypothetical protein WEB53_04760 [Akkermansiaceae bacterium]